MAFSYPMILYSSEARGYALAIFFALLAFIALRAGDPARRGAIPVFWLSVTLGFLSHLTFAHVYFALLAWSIARPLLRREPFARGLASAARWHAVPLLFLAAFYAVSRPAYDARKGAADPASPERVRGAHAGLRASRPRASWRRSAAGRWPSCSRAPGLRI